MKYLIMGILGIRLMNLIEHSTLITTKRITKNIKYNHYLNFSELRFVVATFHYI